MGRIRRRETEEYGGEEVLYPFPSKGRGEGEGGESSRWIGGDIPPRTGKICAEGEMKTNCAKSIFFGAFTRGLKTGKSRKAK